MGDPEGIILLKQLDSKYCNFSSICIAITNNQLKSCNIVFKSIPAVCYYLVPMGYPNDAIMDFDINLDCITYEDIENIYSASIDLSDKNTVVGKGSRSFAICCSSSTLHLAQNDCFNIVNKFMCYNNNKFVSRTDLVNSYKSNTMQT